jgi:PEGA domain
MRKVRQLAVVAGFSLLSSVTGCATMFNPGPDVVRINSVPSGARVCIDDAVVGETPLTTNVGRKAGSISLDLPGYQSKKFKVDRHLNGWFLGDVALLSPLGVVVDVLSGNMMEAPKEINVNLAPAGQASANPSWTSRMAAVQSKFDTWMQSHKARS